MSDTGERDHQGATNRDGEENMPPAKDIKSAHAYSAIDDKYSNVFHVDDISIDSGQSPDPYDVLLANLAEESNDYIKPQESSKPNILSVMGFGNVFKEKGQDDEGDAENMKKSNITPCRGMILLALVLIFSVLLGVVFGAALLPSETGKSISENITDSPTSFPLPPTTSSPTGTTPTTGSPSLRPTSAPTGSSPTTKSPTPFPTREPSASPTQAPTSATTVPPTSSPITFEERITRICAERKAGNTHIGICLDEDNFAQCTPDGDVKFFSKSCTNGAKCVCDPFVRVKDLRPCDGNSKDDDCVLF